MTSSTRWAFALGLLLLGLGGGDLSAQEVKKLTSRPGEKSLSRDNAAAGVYDITFRLKLDRQESTVTPLATLTVNAGEYPGLIHRVVTPMNFTVAGTPQDFAFRFDNFKAQSIQAAVELSRHEHAVPGLTVDRITIARAPGVSVGTVWPGKVLYYRDEDATGFVTVHNGTDAAREVTLRCTLESDLDKVRPLKEESLTLAPGERREVSLKWNTGKEEYGFALSAVLLDAQGKQISKGKEYFSVADNLWKVGITQSGRGSRVPGGPQSNEGVPLSQVKAWEEQLAAALAKPFAPVYWTYNNYNEFFAWSKDDFFRLAPNEDYWYSGVGTYSTGKRQVQMAIEWLHRRGMRAISYLNPSSCGYGAEEVYRRHPEWFIYEENGALEASVYYQKKLEAGANFSGENPWPLHLSPYALIVRPNLATLDVIDAHIDQIVKSHKMFGWDGVRYDNFVFSAAGYDFYGNKIDGNDPKKRDELESRAWARLRDRLGEEIGSKFAIGDNFDYRLRDRHPAAWDELSSKGQLVMEEMARSSYNLQSPQNRWQDFMSYYHETGEIVRSRGAHHLIIGIDKQYPVDHLYLNIFTYAGRTHPYSWQYNSDNLPIGNYAQFITRYSSLMWDIERVKALPDPGEIIQVESSNPIWWKDYACIRQAPNGKRQYIIHLVNPPVQERIYTDPMNKVPRPQSNITVSLKAGKGGQITKAWLLSAEPVTRREPLRVTRTGNTTSVIVPKLSFWSMVVLE